MINPSIAPKPAKDTIPPVIEIYKDLLFSFVPLTALIVTVLGSILGGLATPAEAAAMGALGSMVLAVLYRALTWQKVQESVFLCAKATCDGVLVVCGLVDLCIHFLISWWPRRDRALGSRNGISTLAVLGDGANNYIYTRVASGVVRNPDHFRADIPADARQLWGEPLLLRDVGRAQFADFVPHPPYGHVSILFEGGSEESNRALDIFKGLMPYLGIVILCMFLLYQFPGIALWLPDYLFGEYIP